MLFSKLIKLFDRSGFRWLAAIIVFLAYRLKGKEIRMVRYNPIIRLWEYQIETSFFLTLTASWFSSDDYYLNTLKKYSGYAYLPKMGENVIDIGAGVGEEVLVLSKQIGSTGKLYAIEANPMTYDVLGYFCKQNNLTNILIFNLAIAASSGTVFIDDDGGYGVQNSISTKSEGKQFQIASVTIDDFIESNSITSVDLLKANIEGAEQFLIQGMSRSINKIKHIAISCHDFRFESGEGDFYRTYDAVYAFLKPHFELTRQQTGDSVRDYYIYGVNNKLSV